jgi:hypothetical protein
VLVHRRFIDSVAVQCKGQDRYVVPRQYFRVTWLLAVVSPALITGGGSGIGKTIASALVQNGAKVYIAARKESQLKEVDTSISRVLLEV